MEDFANDLVGGEEKVEGATIEHESVKTETQEDVAIEQKADEADEVKEDRYDSIESTEIPVAVDVTEVKVVNGDDIVAIFTKETDGIDFIDQATVFAAENGYEIKA